MYRADDEKPLTGTKESYICTLQCLVFRALSQHAHSSLKFVCNPEECQEARAGLLYYKRICGLTSAA